MKLKRSRTSASASRREAYRTYTNYLGNDTIRLVFLLLLLPQSVLCGLRFAKAITTAPRGPL